MAAHKSKNKNTSKSKSKLEFTSTMLRTSPHSLGRRKREVGMTSRSARALTRAILAFTSRTNKGVRRTDLLIESIPALTPQSGDVTRNLKGKGGKKDKPGALKEVAEDKPGALKEVAGDDEAKDGLEKEVAKPGDLKEKAKGNPQD